MFVRLEVGHRDVRIVRWSGFIVSAGVLALNRKMTRGPELMRARVFSFFPSFWFLLVESAVLNKR